VSCLVRAPSHCATTARYRRYRKVPLTDRTFNDGIAGSAASSRLRESRPTRRDDLARFRMRRIGSAAGRKDGRDSRGRGIYPALTDQFQIDLVFRIRYSSPIFESPVRRAAACHVCSFVRTGYISARARVKMPMLRAHGNPGYIYDNQFAVSFRKRLINRRGQNIKPTG